MCQVIITPSTEKPEFVSVFLAGGITNCKEWQKEVISNLDSCPVSVFNPRQEHFDITDKNASFKQIKWEYERLEQMDIFSMYFCADNSDQPICMYELGRNIVRMQNRFPNDWKSRIKISVEKGYKRAADVQIQVGLCCPDLYVEMEANSYLHSYGIKNAVQSLAWTKDNR